MALRGRCLGRVAHIFGLTSAHLSTHPSTIPDTSSLRSNKRSWEKENPIADAPSILEYMNRVSKKHGIYDHIQFHNAVQKLEWKSDQQRWFVTSLINGEKEKTISARQILLGTGYYDQKHPLAAQIPGLENFRGQIIHPQFWPEDYDYTDKKAVIIGSGATAVSILPVMAQKAKHVTQLQRSPGYFLPVPTTGQPLDNFVRRWFPTSWAHSLIRTKFMVMGFVSRSNLGKPASGPKPFPLSYELPCRGLSR